MPARDHKKRSTSNLKRTTSNFESKAIVANPHRHLTIELNCLMIDLHCHILHGFDDGPEIFAESVQMAQAFARSGYQIIAATPHMIPGTAWMPSTDRIKKEVSGLNQTIENAGLELEIVFGMEIAMDPQITDLLDDERLLPLGNSSFLLIEPPFQQLPPNWEQIIFSILAKGYSILIAHPERCGQLADNPGLIDELIKTGVFLQVSWGSFFGQYGRAAARLARIMATKGQIHCLATDSHHLGGHNPSMMHTAGLKLRKLIGLENVRKLTTDNPQRVLNGKPPQPMTLSAAMTARKRRWWRWW